MLGKCFPPPPESSASDIIIPIDSGRYPSGLAKCYSASYPKELEGTLPSSQFKEIMQRINLILQGYWPCLCCLHCSYLLALCTCGLSILPTCCCVCEAEKELKNYLFNLSRRNPNLEWALEKHGMTSWIKVHLRNRV